MVATARLDAQRGVLRQQVDQVADELDFLLCFQLAAQVFGLGLAESRVAQDLVQTQAVVQAQLAQDTRGGHAPGKIPELPGHGFRAHL